MNRVYVTQTVASSFKIGILFTALNGRQRLHDHVSILGHAPQITVKIADDRCISFGTELVYRLPLAADLSDKIIIIIIIIITASCGVGLATPGGCEAAVYATRR